MLSAILNCFDTWWPFNNLNMPHTISNSLTTTVPTVKNCYPQLRRKLSQNCARRGCNSMVERQLTRLHTTVRLATTRVASLTIAALMLACAASALFDYRRSFFMACAASRLESFSFSVARLWLRPPAMRA